MHYLTFQLSFLTCVSAARGTNEHNVAAIPWSPLARGLLAGTRQHVGDRSTTRCLDKVLYDQPSDMPVVDAAHKVGAARALLPAQITSAWLLRQPVAAAPIIGATKLSHLADAIAAVDVTLEPAGAQLLQAPYRPHPVEGLAVADPLRIGRR